MTACFLCPDRGDRAKRCEQKLKKKKQQQQQQRGGGVGVRASLSFPPYLFLAPFLRAAFHCPKAGAGLGYAYDSSMNGT